MLRRFGKGEERDLSHLTMLLIVGRWSQSLSPTGRQSLFLIFQIQPGGLGQSLQYKPTLERSAKGRFALLPAVPFCLQLPTLVTPFFLQSPTLFTLLQLSPYPPLTTSMANTRQAATKPSTRSTRSNNQAGPTNSKRPADTAEGGRPRKKAKTTGPASVQTASSSARGKGKGMSANFPSSLLLSICFAHVLP